MAFGELTLDGKIRGVPGALNRYLSLAASDNLRLLVPRACKRELSMMSHGHPIFVSSLPEAVALLNGQPYPADGNENGRPNIYSVGDFRVDERNRRTCPGDHPGHRGLVGQDQAVRAAMIAAAGQHNLLMLGSPGCGKTALANDHDGHSAPLTATSR
jgi:magnesium chelatase family protein